MQKPLDRREFLKLGGVLGAGLLINPFPPPRDEEMDYLSLGRVTYHSISVFAEPHVDAKQIDYRFRDELFWIYRTVTPETGPEWNPVWHKIHGGYVHSAFVQKSLIRHNRPASQINPNGELFRLTVPYSPPYNYNSYDGWNPNPEFYLYYDSIHWVVDIVEGPDKQPWYKISDELWQGYYYYVPANHLRKIPPEETAPISPEVPAEEKWIQVQLYGQILRAFEGNTQVLETKISSGIPGESTNNYPTSTPLGTHYIYNKMPSKHMGIGRLTDSLDDRALPGVPWTCFFADGGYALHGTYWHNNFGVQMSRGCVNLRNDDANWIFRWTTPQVEHDEWEIRQTGTRIEVV